MKTFIMRVMAMALLSSFALSANSATMTGQWLDSNQWSLIHGGSNPGGDGASNEYLRWLPGQTVIFDLTGSTFSTSGSQDFDLISNKGSTATFTLLSSSIDLSDSDGFASGSMDYSLVVADGPLEGTYNGTFTFVNQNYGTSPFNSSGTDAGIFSIFAWGGDDANGLGIDVGISAPVPLPAPLLLFTTGLFGLGLIKRRR